MNYSFKFGYIVGWLINTSLILKYYYKNTAYTQSRSAATSKPLFEKYMPL